MAQFAAQRHQHHSEAAVEMLSDLLKSSKSRTSDSKNEPVVIVITTTTRAYAFGVVTVHCNIGMRELNGNWEDSKKSKNQKTSLGERMQPEETESI